MMTRQCLYCQTSFETNKLIRVYCTRKCFKRAYAIKEREKAKALENNRPTITCEECEAVAIIDFDPIREWWKLEGHFCPFCFTPHRNGDPRTPEMIRVSFGFTGTFNSMISHTFSFSFTS